MGYIRPLLILLHVFCKHNHIFRIYIVIRNKNNYLLCADSLAGLIVFLDPYRSFDGLIGWWQWTWKLRRT